MAFSAHKTEEEYKEFIDSDEVLDNKVTQLAEWIKASKHTIAFTGAGVSTATGIPDYRSGKDTKTGMGAGCWTAKAQGLTASEEEQSKRVTMLSAIPSKTHMALVALEKAGLLRFLISQNTDGMHRKSGVPPNKLAELHGNTNLEVCAKCQYEFLRDYQTRRAGNGVFVHDTGRICTRAGCGGSLQDSIINFGENLPEKCLKQGFFHAEGAEVCIVMGSSLRVSPANEMPKRVAERNQKLIIVNLQKTPLDGCAAMRIGALCDSFMELLMKKLGVEIPEFQLRRFVRFAQSADGQCTVQSVDSDGTPMSLFTRVTVTNPSGQKHNSCLEPFLFQPGVVQGGGKALLEFRGHYNEAPLEMDVPSLTKDQPVRDFVLFFDPKTGLWENPREVEVSKQSQMTTSDEAADVMIVPLINRNTGAGSGQDPNDLAGDESKRLADRSAVAAPRPKAGPLPLDAPHISGLWLGQAVPDPKFSREIAINPIKWSLCLVRGPEPSAFGAGYFDDAADIPNQPLVFYTLRGAWKPVIRKVSFKKLYSGAAAETGYCVDYEGELSVENGAYVLKGTWKNEMGGCHGSFAARRENPC